MPELLTRMDSAGWLTPSIAEVLDPLLRPPYDEDFTRRQAISLQKKLGDLGIPITVVGVGALPSHTLFALQPEGAGRRGKHRQVTADDIREHLDILAAELGAIEIDVMDRLNRIPGAIGLLVRNDGHHQLQLRHLLVRPEFVEHPSNTALALGMDVEQLCIVRDLTELPHLLISGDERFRTGLVNVFLTTFLLFNTPAEWRIALIGNDGDMFSRYKGVPHLLGQPVTTPANVRKLMDNLLREMQRRRKLFSGSSVKRLAEYNQAMLSQGRKSLPRILLVINPPVGGGWEKLSELWPGTLTGLLRGGPQVGLYCILSAESPGPDSLLTRVASSVPIRMVCADAEDEMARMGDRLTGLPLRFVDAILLDSDGQITALQVGKVTDDEVTRVADYWRRAMSHRRGAIEEPKQATSERVEPPSDFISDEDTIYNRAHALAAYLGWLAVGPLRDVFGLSEDSAHRILVRMQNEGILEPGDGPVLRHRRLDGGPPTVK